MGTQTSTVDLRICPETNQYFEAYVQIQRFASSRVLLTVLAEQMLVSRNRLTGSKVNSSEVKVEDKMDRYHLMHRTKCRWVVIIEMLLAGLRVLVISLSLVQFILHSSTSSTGSHPSGDSHLSEFIAHYWMVFLSVLGVDVILLILGKKVLLACREVGTELRKPISACRVWCRLELFRMLIFVITFLVDVYEQQFNLHQYMFQIPITLILLFGWFFVNEYRKELTVKSASHLQMITQPVNGFQAIQEPRVVYFAPSVPNVYNFE